MSKIVKNTVAVLAFFDQQKGSVTSNNNNGATYTANNEKGQVLKTIGLQFDNWLFGPEKVSGLSRNRPQFCRTERTNDLRPDIHIFQTSNSLRYLVTLTQFSIRNNNKNREEMKSSPLEDAQSKMMDNE